ncbi:MAG: tetratricopeptide repeat protein, partial [Candidatus Glassbacteria bacterium]|nr:tetratricopeptide repeat protein [Candidatus Glassbacteria bacterium]
MADPLPKKPFWPRLAVLLLAVLALYLRSLENGYVGWDDDLILNNPLIGSLSAENLSGIFLVSPLQSGTFQPLRTLCYALVYAVSGTSPKGYLILNILLYLANVWLVYLLVRELLRAYGTGLLAERAQEVSLVAAAAFAFHPVHVEVVSWLQGGKQTLMAAFFMGSFILYSRYCRSGKASAYWGSAALHWAALATQPGAISLPLILVFHEGLLARREQRRSFKWWLGLGLRMLPFLLPVLVLGAHLWFFSTVRWLAGPEPPVVSRIFNLPLLWGGYLAKLLLPVNLCCRYPADVPLQPPLASGLGAALLLVLVAYGAWRASGSGRPALLALAWFAAAALPTSGLVRTSTLMADRYLYLPSLGFALILSMILARLVYGAPPGGRAGRAFRTAVLVLAAAAAAGWGTVSLQRQADWRSAMNLWSRLVKIYPGHDLGHFNLADAYRDSGRPDQAIEHYRRAIEINPGYAKAYSNLGVCLRAAGQKGPALAMLERARRLDPGRSEIWVNLGISYAELGQDSLALAAFDQALALGLKGNRTAYFNRAQLLFSLGETERALADLEKAVREYPKWLDTGAWLAIGRRLVPLGKVQLAVELMSLGTGQAAFSAECWRMLGNLQIMAGRPVEALSSLQRAGEMEPDNAENFVLLGVASQQAGRPGRAAALYREALQRTTADRPQLLNNLGRALIQAGELSEAETALKSALEEDPGCLDARMNLG